MDEVGGPEERIERIGVLKSVCCWADNMEEAESDSGINMDCSREEVRLPSSNEAGAGAGAGPCPVPGPWVKGDDREDEGGKAHGEDCAFWRAI